MSDTDVPGTDRVTASDLRLRTSDEGPVLEIAGEVSVLLKTVVDSGGTALDSAAESSRTDIDSNGPEAVWWNICPGDDTQPCISIEPVVLDPEEDR